MEIGEMPDEALTTLHDGLPFVESSEVQPGASNEAAVGYTITGPEDRVIFIEGGTEVAPELNGPNGEKLDPSTRVIIQKCNKQGDPLGNGIVLSEHLGRFRYEDMRNDPDYMRYTNKTLMIDEYEIVKVFVKIPNSASRNFDPTTSTFTVGDDTSDFGTPVEIVEHDDLTQEELQAVKMASQRGGN